MGQLGGKDCKVVQHQPPQAVTDPAPPQGPGGALRVVRGGSWSLYGQYMRAAFRDLYFPPGNRNHTVGFRCVRGRP